MKSENQVLQMQFPVKEVIDIKSKKRGESAL